MGTIGKCPDKCSWCDKKCGYRRYHSPNKKCNCGGHKDHPMENLNYGKRQ